MIHGILFGLGLCLAPFLLAAMVDGWRWIFAGLIAIVALVFLVIVHVTGVADWRLVALAFLAGTIGSFTILPAAGFDPLRAALFLNAGLIAAAVFLVQHTVPPEPDRYQTTISIPQG